MDIPVGSYIQRESPLLKLYDDRAVRLIAFLHSEDISRIEKERAVKFISDDGQLILKGFKIERFAPEAVQILPYPSLAARFGGKIPVKSLEDALIPEQALYEVTLMLANTKMEQNVRQQRNGKAILALQPESYLQRGIRYLYGVIIRESGF